MIINEVNIEKTKQLLKKAEKPVIIAAQDDIFNRKMLEYGKFDLLLGLEKIERKDKLKQLDSGFNHVLAAIAAKNKIEIGVDLNQIRKLDKKEKAKQLARIIQNIKISRKNKVNIRFFNFKEKKDVFSLMQNLGASSKQAKEAISF